MIRTAIFEKHGRPDVNLRQMKVGQRARVVFVSAGGEMGRRIREMGLVPGVDIQVIGRAPLKDPVALRLKDFTLTLRNNEADHIEVELAESGGPDL